MPEPVGAVENQGASVRVYINPEKSHRLRPTLRPDESFFEQQGRESVVQIKTPGYLGQVEEAMSGLFNLRHAVEISSIEYQELKKRFPSGIFLAPSGKDNLQNKVRAIFSVAVTREIAQSAFREKIRFNSLIQGQIANILDLQEHDSSGEIGNPGIGARLKGAELLLVSKLSNFFTSVPPEKAVNRHQRSVINHEYEHLRQQLAELGATATDEAMTAEGTKGWLESHQIDKFNPAVKDNPNFQQILAIVDQMKILKEAAAMVEELAIGQAQPTTLYSEQFLLRLANLSQDFYCFGLNKSRMSQTISSLKTSGRNISSDNAYNVALAILLTDKPDLLNEYFDKSDNIDPEQFELDLFNNFEQAIKNPEAAMRKIMQSNIKSRLTGLLGKRVAQFRALKKTIGA